MTHILRIDEMANNSYCYGSLKREDFINSLAEDIADYDDFYRETANDIATEIVDNFKGDGKSMPHSSKNYMGFIKNTVEQILEPYNGSTEEDFNQMVDHISMWVYQNII